jgi:Importin beta binding domain
MDPNPRAMDQRRQSSFISICCATFVDSLWSDFKNKGLKQEDLRRRREEQQVEIRRQKREENIAKRRNFQPAAGTDSDEEVGGATWDFPVCLFARYYYTISCVRF